MIISLQIFYILQNISYSKVTTEVIINLCNKYDVVHLIKIIYMLL